MERYVEGFMKGFGIRDEKGHLRWDNVSKWGLLLGVIVIATA